MTRLWRISNHCDLTGLGGEKTDGRWHTAARGKRIVYLSEHPALALIEALVGLKGNPALFPDRYQLLEVAIEEWLVERFRSVTGPGDLIPDRTTSLQWTQQKGDHWLQTQESAFLVVPSFPSPSSFNYLFNPLHPDAGGAKIKSCRWIEYDKRLFHAHK